MVSLCAWLRKLRAAFITDDPDPQYSQLDVMDGLGPLDRMPGPSEQAKAKAKSEDGTRRIDPS